ncbi:MAG TPA: hypothetical protein VEU54_07155 [Steroidobacteraceae bacterium]|nr:hypothetical protein [Steroidobacteraceae bacterium]
MSRRLLGRELGWILAAKAAALALLWLLFFSGTHRLRVDAASAARQLAASAPAPAAAGPRR